MNEFMFFIRKQARSETKLSPDEHRQFLKACEVYIEKLKDAGRMISARPIDWKGTILAANDEGWMDAPFDEQGEVIGGYYHILADDLDDAVFIAKDNPEFQFNPDTRIEVRPVTMKEDSTGFVYPKE
jgi:hypothetical protein